MRHNKAVYDANTIANYDPEIISFLECQSAPGQLGTPRRA